MSSGQNLPQLVVDTVGIDRLADEFERLLRGNQAPRIEDYLEKVAVENRPTAFREFLKVEIELRRSKQEHVRLQDYLGRFVGMDSVVHEMCQPSDVVLATTHYAGPIDSPRRFQGDAGRDQGSGSGRLEVRCPGCHEPTNVAVDTSLTDLTCSSCGSHFSLVDQTQVTRIAPSLSRLGRFELVERIGVGGFGSVWKARDKELDRTVAIKVPRAGNMSQEEHEKFFREARAAAQLRHPNIVSVHEVGRDGDSVFIVSDFVRGVTLGDWLTGQQLTSRESAELCSRIAEALHHAHEQGVVHRDLKPANVMIDNEDAPHLMDFGLARRESGEVSMTLDGQVLGTPAYMSPEQAQGDSHLADRRSDIYSLGVILFQLLTNELPFRGNARMLIKQVVHDEPPAPRKLNSNIHRDLETIVLKCLEKIPARRYQTAMELREELQRFLTGKPIHARPTGRIERVLRWSIRNPSQSSLVVVSLLSLILLAGLAAGLVFHSQLQSALAAEKESSRHAELESERARDAYRKSEELYQETRALKQQLAWTAYSHGVGLAYRDWQEADIGASRAALANSDAEHRDWEWRYLRRLCDGNSRKYAEHVSAVWSAVESPDRTLIATASEDNTIKIWKASTAECLRTMDCAAWHVAFSPDGKHIASAGKDGQLSIWDANTGELKSAHNAGRSGGINQVVFSHDGKSLFFAGGTIGRSCFGDADADPDVNAVGIFDIKTHSISKVLRGHTTSVLSLARSADSKLVATGDFNGLVLLWDVAAEKVLRKWNGNKVHVDALVFAPDNQTIFSGGEDRNVYKWSINSDEPLAVFDLPSGVVSLSVSPNGEILSCGLQDSTIQLLNAESGKKLMTLRGHEGQVRSVAFLADDSQLLSGSSDRSARMWNLSQPQEFRTMRGFAPRLNGIAFLNGTERLATGSADSICRIWNIVDGALIREIDTEQEQIDHISVSPNGKLIACAGNDGTIHIYEQESGRHVRSLEKHTGLVWQLTFSSDGTRIASGGYDGVVNIWDANTGAIVRKFPGVCAAFSPDARRVAIGMKPAISVYDIDSGEQLVCSKAHVDFVANVAFSPDGRRVISGSWDRTAKLWNAGTGEQIAQYQGTEGVYAVKFNPTGTRVALVDGPRLKILKSDTLEELLALTPTGNNLHTLAFSDDGNLLASGGLDSLAFIWDGTPLKTDDQAKGDGIKSQSLQE